MLRKPFRGRTNRLIRAAAALALATTPTMAFPATSTVEIASAGWSIANARDLLAAVEASREEGLNPADYQLTALRQAVESGIAGPSLDMIAGAAARALAQDYLSGRVADRSRFDWHIERPLADGLTLQASLDRALEKQEVSAWLKSLLPSDPNYAALRKALAETPPSDVETVTRLRANLERMRWMPRQLGREYLYVNIPSYRLDVVKDGTKVSDYTVVVGAKATPTPQLALHAQSVVVNPWWNVPQSIAKKGVSGQGFIRTRNPDGTVRLRQKPGPSNALGKIKIDMPNPHAIYLHDTPSKAAFQKEQRALSHGCIRVKDIDQLAAELHEDPTDLHMALADSETETIPLQKSVPVYLVYFTAVKGEDGRLKMLDDIYGRDAAVVAAMDGRVRMASR